MVASNARNAEKDANHAPLSAKAKVAASANAPGSSPAPAPVAARAPAPWDRPSSSRFSERLILGLPAKRPRLATERFSPAGAAAAGAGAGAPVKPASQLPKPAQQKTKPAVAARSGDRITEEEQEEELEQVVQDEDDGMGLGQELVLLHAGQKRTAYGTPVPGTGSAPGSSPAPMPAHAPAPAPVAAYHKLLLAGQVPAMPSLVSARGPAPAVQLQPAAAAGPALVPVPTPESIAALRLQVEWQELQVQMQELAARQVKAQVEIARQEALMASQGL